MLCVHTPGVNKHTFCHCECPAEAIFLCHSRLDPESIFCDTENMNKRGNALIIILAILAMVGLTSTGYFLWLNKQPASKPTQNPAPQKTDLPTTPDPTANWKTYTNQKYNFSFKYPSSWTISSQGKNDTYNLLLGFSGPDIKNYEVISFAVKENLNTQDEIKSLNQLSDTFGSKVLKTENLSVGNNKGIVITYSTAEGNTPEEAVIEHKGNIYLFIHSPNINLDQILSTFKFLDQKIIPSTPPDTTSDEPANIDTYKGYPSLP